MGLIDIILVNYHSAKDIQMALQALYPWQHGEIIIVENSADEKATSELKEVLQQFPISTTLLIAEKNLGFAGGCNLAFERSIAEHVLLLNPDAIIDEENILKLHQSLLQDRKVGAVTPNIFWDKQHRFLLPAALPPTPIEQIKSIMSLRFPSLGRSMGERYCHSQRIQLIGGTTFTVPFVTGAILLLRRSAVVAAGGLFDPRFFMFYEDSDLSIRLRDAGYRLLLDSDTHGIHTYRHKTYKLPMMEQTRKQYYEKNYPWLWRLGNLLTRTGLRPKALAWEDWQSVQLAPCATVSEFNAQLGEQTHLLALSPSPSMVPSLIAVNAKGAPLTEDDWDSLEPGQYMAKLSRSDELQWVTISITRRHN